MKYKKQKKISPVIPSTESTVVIYHLERVALTLCPSLPWSSGPLLMCGALVPASGLQAALPPSWRPVILGNFQTQCIFRPGGEKNNSFKIKQQNLGQNFLSLCVRFELHFCGGQSQACTVRDVEFYF